MRVPYARVLRILTSAALLLLAWRLVDAEAVLLLLATMDTALLCIAVVLTVPMHIASAARWQFTCTRIGVPLTFTDALREYYLASLLNTVLPGGIGGDAARVWRHGRQQLPPSTQARTLRSPKLGRYTRPLHGVLIERFIGQCALFATLGAGIAVNHQRLPPWLIELLAGFALLAVVGAACWLLLTRPATTAQADSTWRGALRDLHEDACRALTPLPTFLIQMTLSLTITMSYLAVFWIAARAVHAPLDASSALLAIPIVLTAMTIPVSVGGLGLREATAALIWPLLSGTASDGAASALVYGLAILLGSLPGVGVALGRKRSP